MPGRQFGQGENFPGVLVNGTTTVNGYSIPIDLNITGRITGDAAEYVASNSVEFGGEFESIVSDEFSASIADGSYAGTGNQVSGGGAYGTAGRYRYGFNGKENDNEVKGVGNQQDYGMRIYDPRLGKFLSVDPLMPEYPFLTPYQFSSNSPIANIDIDGLERYSFQLAIDNKTGKPVLSNINVQETFSNSKNKIPLSYQVTYNNNSYSFSSVPLLAGDFGMAPVNSTDNFENWYYSAMNGAEGLPSFGDLFYSRQECKVELGTEMLNEWADMLSQSKAVEPKGSIYEVPGSSTNSGDPYIGRHNKSTPNETRKSNDGRDRTKAKVVDQYNAENSEEGSYKEQKAMDARGGVKRIDNKRREVNPLRMSELEKKYGRGTNKIVIPLPRSKSQQKKENDTKRLDETILLNHG